MEKANDPTVKAAWQKTLVDFITFLAVPREQEKAVVGSEDISRDLDCRDSGSRDRSRFWCFFSLSTC